MRTRAKSNHAADPDAGKSARIDARGFGSPVARPLFYTRGAAPPLALIAALLSLVIPVAAQASGEYSVKAAFLYNFPKFVEWPADASGEDSSFLLGVLGDDPFGESLDQIVGGKTVNGRRIVVRRLKWGEDLRQCQMLFISSSEQRRLPQIFARLKGASVLTVGETDQFVNQGGIIRLVIADGKVRFDINAGAAKQARLRLSSKLLSLARAVIGQHERGSLP